MLKRIKVIVEGTDTRLGLLFDLAIQTLILVSLISFSIETLPNLSDSTRRALNLIELVTILIFTVEYALRVLVADNRPRFIFSFFGLVDLIAILPFYVSTGLDLRSIRILRMLRLLRILKLARYNKALIRLRDAFVDIKEELVLFFSATCMLLFISSVGIYYFENAAQPEQYKSIFHSLWWSVITLTTVGYGDVYPVTTGGKMFTSIVAILGIGVVAVPTGLLSSALTKVIDKSDDTKT